MNPKREGDLTEAELALVTLMSDFSESVYAAAWMIDLEYCLWEVLHDRPSRSAFDGLDTLDRHRLRDAYLRAQVWPYYLSMEEMRAQGLPAPDDHWYDLYSEPEWLAHLMERLL